MPLKVRRRAARYSPTKEEDHHQDIAIFSRQLATMMSAGVPMVQAFDIVGRGHNNPSMAEMILAIKADVEGRHPLTPRCASTRCISTTGCTWSRPRTGRRARDPARQDRDPTKEKDRN